MKIKTNLRAGILVGGHCAAVAAARWPYTSFTVRPASMPVG